MNCHASLFRKHAPVSSCVHSKGPRRECPDYGTAGPHSCHFDGSHTTIWSVYCMNVMAVTATRNYTSQQHCLDVADIGERTRTVTRTVPGVSVSTETDHKWLWWFISDW